MSQWAPPGKRPACPHCGRPVDTRDLLDDWVTPVDGEIDERECAMCDKPFRVRISVEYRYSVEVVR